jgi:oligopeptide/dipeptide ABC transporter ATP-binding protein
MDALVEARAVEMTFASGRSGRHVNIHVLRKISFDIGHGETVGLVGESGSGKSTIGRIVVGLHEPTGGSLKLFGLPLTGPNRNANLSTVRSRAQFVFQDPHAALNPRMRAGDSIAEPIDVIGSHTRRDRNDRVKELLRLVGLPYDAADRFPHEFSGGQRQRIVIARALALEPLFIVCDEPVSALDVSMQAQVVNLLMDLQDGFGIGYLFIAHDLAVVRAVSHRVAVIYAGAIVELAEKNALFGSPQHPYTRALLDAVPRPDPNRIRNRVIVGEVPSLISPPSGCRFHPRCPRVMPKCEVDEPVLRETSPGRFTACHLYGTS